MTKLKPILFFGLFLFILSSFIIPPPPKKFHDLKIATLNGKDTILFSAFKGKKVLCVNTASECGYTPQYKALQELADKYKDKLVVIGFPCNQFGEQEPGNAEQIEQFCKRRYSVTFPITEKIDVKGDLQHPVYQWLTQKQFNGKEDINVRWNFGKFMIDEKGNFMEYFPSQVTPMDEKIISLIEGSK
ncbi:MAG: glutathione peroxidase [Bacteroidia bacterium]|jgi:glutathione peroxidase